MPNRSRDFQGGKVDFLSLFGLVFLVVSLVTITSITSNPLKTQLISSFAKGKDSASSFQNYVDSKIRQRERTGSCKGSGCVAEDVINNAATQGNNNSAAPSAQTAAEQEIIDTYNKALAGDPDALKTLKDKNVNLANQVETQLAQKTPTNTTVVAENQNLAQENKIANTDCTANGGTYNSATGGCLKFTNTTTTTQYIGQGVNIQSTVTTLKDINTNTITNITKGSVVENQLSAQQLQVEQLKQEAAQLNIQNISNNTNTYTKIPDSNPIPVNIADKIMQILSGEGGYTNVPIATLLNNTPTINAFGLPSTVAQDAINKENLQRKLTAGGIGLTYSLTVLSGGLLAPIAADIGIPATLLYAGSAITSSLPAWVVPTVATTALVLPTTIVAKNQYHACGFAGSNFDTAECQAANDVAIQFAAGFQSELISNSNLETSLANAENKAGTQVANETAAIAAADQVAADLVTPIKTTTTNPTDMLFTPQINEPSSLKLGSQILLADTKETANSLIETQVPKITNALNNAGSSANAAIDQQINTFANSKAGNILFENTENIAANETRNFAQLSPSTEQAFSNITDSSLVAFEHNRALPPGQDLSLTIAGNTYRPSTVEEAENLVSYFTGRTATIDSSGVVNFVTEAPIAQIPSVTAVEPATQNENPIVAAWNKLWSTPEKGGAVNAVKLADNTANVVEEAKPGLLTQVQNWWDEKVVSPVGDFIFGNPLPNTLDTTSTTVTNLTKLSTPNQSEIDLAAKEADLIINDPAFQRIKTRAEALRAANESGTSALTPEQIAQAHARSEYTAKISDEMTAIQRNLGRATREARAAGAPAPRLQYDKLSEVVMSLPNESTSFTIDNITNVASRFDYTGDLSDLQIFFDVNGGTATRREILDFAVDNEINPVQVAEIRKIELAIQTNITDNANVTVDAANGVVTRNPKPESSFQNYNPASYNNYLEYEFRKPASFYQEYGGKYGIPEYLGVTPEGGFKLSYVPGTPLSDFTGKLSPEEIENAVNKLQTQINNTGIAHGDIGPSNILVDTLPDGTHDINFIDYTGYVRDEAQKSYDVNSLRENLLAKNTGQDINGPSFLGLEWNGFKNSDGNFKLWPFENAPDTVSEATSGVDAFSKKGIPEPEEALPPINKQPNPAVNTPPQVVPENNNTQTSTLEKIKKSLADLFGPKPYVSNSVTAQMADQLNNSEVLGATVKSYQENYGPLPKTLDVIDPNKFYKFQNDILKITSADDYESAMNQAIKELEKKDVVVKIIDNINSLEQITGGGIGGNKAAIKKTTDIFGNVINKKASIVYIGTPKIYASEYGVDLDTAKLITLQKLGHEGGHGLDYVGGLMESGNTYTDAWATELRQKVFNQIFYERVGAEEAAATYKAFADEVYNLTKVIIK